MVESHKMDAPRASVAVKHARDEEDGGERDRESKRTAGVFIFYPLLFNLKGGGCALKILVSNGSAGMVIGKGGLTIGQIQTETTARVKLSQNREYFPGTSERIVLIQGTVETVTAASRMTLEKALNSGEHAPPDPPETPRTVRYFFSFMWLIR